MEKTLMDLLDLECDVPLTKESEMTLIQTDNKYEIQLSADNDPAMDCVTMTLVLEGKTVNVPVCEDEYLYATVGKDGGEIFQSIETNSTRIKKMLEGITKEEETDKIQPRQEGYEILEPPAGCLPDDESPTDSMASAMILGAFMLSRVRRLMKK